MTFLVGAAGRGATIQCGVVACKLHAGNAFVGEVPHLHHRQHDMPFLLQLQQPVGAEAFPKVMPAINLLLPRRRLHVSSATVDRMAHQLAMGLPGI